MTTAEYEKRMAEAEAADRDELADVERSEIKRLAAVIAPGIIALTINPVSGQHTGRSDDGVVARSVKLARDIIACVNAIPTEEVLSPAPWPSKGAI